MNYSADAANPPASFPIRRCGEYELIREIKSGGMGVVYEARDRKLNRRVALKRILPHALIAPGTVERFRIEARSAAALHHPGIVPVYEIGEENGQPFLVMQFANGGSLQQHLTDGPLPPRLAADVVRQLAEAVQHAHDHGVVHRDLKPGNILLHHEGADSAVATSSGSTLRGARLSGSLPSGLRVQLADFGLARLATEDGNTRTGDVMGTPSYMPPEQAVGNKKAIGPLVDIYSLGAVLYALLTGRPPFQAATPLEVLRMVQDQEPVSPRRLNPAVSLDLQAVCLRCLEKDPARRYPSAAALSEDLSRYLRGEPTQARPARVVERTVKWVRRYPVPAALLGVVLLGVLALSMLTISLAAARAEAENKSKEADKQRQEADRQAGIARGKEEEAEKQRQKADRQAEIALANEKNAKREAARARSSLQFLVEFFERGPSMTGRQILNDAERRLPTLFDEQPDLRSELQREVNKALDKLTATAPLAMILEMRGTVSLETKQQPGRHAKRSTLLYAGDTLTLGEDAQVRVVVLSDLHQETLRSGTTTTPARKGLQPATAVRERSDDLMMPFARLPKGTFYMGWDGENKGKLTEIKEDFEICLYDVTQGQWETVMGNNPSYFDRVPDLTDEERKLLPVEQVSWEDAQKFIAKLNEKYSKKGYLYRLPTEAEWEYACRGGATTLEECSYHFYLDKPTNDLSSEQANFNGNFPEGNAPKGKFLGRTTRVGAYPPNKLGLCDMHGNVWQWTASEEGSGRVIRGGSWYGDGRSCRAAGRSRSTPAIRSSSVGFRLARSFRPQSSQAR